MNKQDILKKLKAFSQRTVENGCTEAEAMVAAKAMQSLQNKYNCTLTELDITLTEYVTEDFSLGNRRKHPVVEALYGVQKFTETKFVYCGSNLEIFGPQHKVDNAVYLITLLMSAMELEFLRYKMTPEYDEQKFYYHGRSIRSSFMNGMGRRLNFRLKEMHKANRNDPEVIRPVSAGGTSLVIVADTALAEAHKKKYPRLGTLQRSTTTRSAGAANAGRSAANRVGLNRGVSGGRATALLAG
jgi:hypothetical protein